MTSGTEPLRQATIGVPADMASIITSLKLVGSLWTWALIVIAHLGYRKVVAIGEIRPVAYRMPANRQRQQ